MTTRLNEALRDRLHKLVQQTVTVPDTRLTYAYNNAEPLVRAIVETKYPTKDMKVCARCDAAQIQDTIRLQLADGGMEEFKFPKGTGPYVIKVTGFDNRIYLAGPDATPKLALDSAAPVWAILCEECGNKDHHAFQRLMCEEGSSSSESKQPAHFYEVKRTDRQGNEAAPHGRFSARPERADKSLATKNVGAAPGS